MDDLIIARRPDLLLIDTKRRTCHLQDFAIPAENR